MGLRTRPEWPIFGEALGSSSLSRSTEENEGNIFIGKLGCCLGVWELNRWPGVGKNSWRDKKNDQDIYSATSPVSYFSFNSKDFFRLHSWRRLSASVTQLSSEVLASKKEYLFFSQLSFCNFRKIKCLLLKNSANSLACWPLSSFCYSTIPSADLSINQLIV